MSQSLATQRNALLLSTVDDVGKYRGNEELFLLAASGDLPLLADAKGDTAVRAVPLGGAGRDLSEADAFEVEPLFFAIVVFAAYHDPKADTVAEAVSRLVGINNVTLVVDFIPDLRGVFLFVLLLFLGTSFLARSRSSLANADG